MHTCSPFVREDGECVHAGLTGIAHHEAALARLLAQDRLAPLTRNSLVVPPSNRQQRECQIPYVTHTECFLLHENKHCFV